MNVDEKSEDKIQIQDELFPVLIHCRSDRSNGQVESSSNRKRINLNQATIQAELSRIKQQVVSSRSKTSQVESSRSETSQVQSSGNLKRVKPSQATIESESSRVKQRWKTSQFESSGKSSQLSIGARTIPRPRSRDRRQWWSVDSPHRPRPGRTRALSRAAAWLRRWCRCALED